MYRIVRQTTGFVGLLIVFQAIITPCGAQARMLSLPVKPDSARVRISERYEHPSLLKQLFLGKNYRKEWSMPVMLPVFDLKALQLQVVEMGGGKQTKSLRLVDRDSVEWALRMVDKDVAPALPPAARNPITLSIVQDMVSAAHPYGPLAVPLLAKATGVKAATPRFFFVPDDPLLGPYREVFAYTVCELEQREIVKGKETENTKKVFNHLLHSYDYVVNQKEYLRARLLDMLIGDWDRHYDQWRWEEKEVNGTTTYLPLPRDRDQTFFYSGGLLVKMVRPLGLRSMVGFTSKTSNLTDFNAVAWSMDLVFLNQLTATDWIQVAERFQQDLQDNTIKEAVKKLPPEIYALDGATLTRKLLNRKKTLPGDVLRYYRFLSKTVTIAGTDKAERFLLSGNKDSITLAVYDATDPHKKLYQRSFDPRVTKKIRLLGLEGDDVFEGTVNGKTEINIEVDGGKGKNHYAIKGVKKLKTFDSDMDADSYEKIVRKKFRVVEEEKDQKEKVKSKK